MSIICKDSWSPNTYNKFEKERSQPFYDLLSLIRPKPLMKILDLGCGTGTLTQTLHLALKAESTLGIDASPAMLEKAHPLASGALTFKTQDINTLSTRKKYDLVFSNAALQWVPDHPALFRKISNLLKEQGQIAIQMPSNFDAPTHTIAANIASRHPYKPFMQNCYPPQSQSLEFYSCLLYSLGYTNPIVRQQVYPLYFASHLGLLNWVKGSLMTFYRSAMPEHIFKEFYKEYARKIKACYSSKPLFIPFKRLLIWAERS